MDARVSAAYRPRIRYGRATCMQCMCHIHAMYVIRVPRVCHETCHGYAMVLPYVRSGCYAGMEPNYVYAMGVPWVLHRPTPDAPRMCYGSATDVHPPA